MEEGERCGAPTNRGTPCQWARESCKWHQGPNAAKTEERDSLGPPVEGYGPEARDLAFAERNPRRVAWWLAAEAARADLSEPPRVTALSNVLRLLHAMGPEPMDEKEALAEVELRGRLMHGLPPREPEEWARAESTFDDEAMAEIRRWERLILARRAGEDIRPLIEAAEDEWAEATDRWREPATHP